MTTPALAAMTKSVWLINNPPTPHPPLCNNSARLGCNYRDLHQSQEGGSQARFLTSELKSWITYILQYYMETVSMGPFLQIPPRDDEEGHCSKEMPSVFLAGIPV